MQNLVFALFEDVPRVRRDWVLDLLHELRRLSHLQSLAAPSART